jgi:hypothetical protein
MSSMFLVMRCTIPFLRVSANFSCSGRVLFCTGSCFGLFRLCRKRNSRLCFSMLLYVCGRYERLYGGLCSIKTCDMSQERHIVSV